MVYKCLIIDDEVPAHLVIKSHISKCDELEFCASAFNGQEAKDLIINQHFDLLFLDIEMPLVNGIELLQDVKNRPLTILTSAHNNFAVEAFENNVVDYLLKPISLDRFLKAIIKFKSHNTFIKKEVDQLLYRLNGVDIAIDLKEVILIQSLGNYVKIYTSINNSPIVYYNSLKNIVKQFSNKQLIQVHKSFLINPSFIDRLESKNVILKNSLVIPIGRKFEILLTNKANRYLNNC